jgi:hypothetical protein
MKTIDFKNLSDDEKKAKFKLCLTRFMPTLSVQEIDLVTNARVNFRNGTTPLYTKQWSIKSTGDIKLFNRTLIHKSSWVNGHLALEEVGTWLIGGGEFGVSTNGVLERPPQIKSPTQSQLIAIASTWCDEKTHFLTTRWQLYGLTHHTAAQCRNSAVGTGVL